MPRNYEDVKSDYDLIRWVQKRLYKQNKNWLSIVVGETGSGKSWTGLKIAQEIDPDFNEDKVVFEPIEFMKRLNDDEWDQGDAVVFDEIGVNMSQKEFMTVTNRLIENVLETFRRHNIAVIFTVPSQKNVDKDIRRLLHTYIQTQTINYAWDRVACKWLRMEYNPKVDKIYYKYPKVKTENSKLPQKRKKVWIGKPDKEIIKAYEDKRSKFQDELEEESLEKIKELMGKSEDSEDKEPTKKDKIKGKLDEGKDPKRISKENEDIDLQYARNIASEVNVNNK